MRRQAIYIAVLFAVALLILSTPFQARGKAPQAPDLPPAYVSHANGVGADKNVKGTDCGCLSGGECTCPVGGCNCVLGTDGYKEALLRHKVEGKTLLVWVGYDCPPCRAATTDCVHFRCKHFPTGGGKEGVFVSVNGKGAHLAGPVTVLEIRSTESQLRDGSPQITRVSYATTQTGTGPLAYSAGFVSPSTGLGCSQCAVSGSNGGTLLFSPGGYGGAYSAPTFFGGGYGGYSGGFGGYGGFSNPGGCAGGNCGGGR